jgi:hypothetical protein
MSSDNKRSIISAIPQDASNIIKEFLVENREVVELKLSSPADNYIHDDYYFIITNYKQGYKIDKHYFDIAQLGIGMFTNLTQEERERLIKEKQQKLDNHFPVYIDTEKDLIEYMFINYILDLETDDDDDEDDYEDEFPIYIELGALKTSSSFRKFRKTLSHYIKMLGKVYKKV